MGEQPTEQDRRAGELTDDLREAAPTRDDEPAPASDQMFDALKRDDFEHQRIISVARQRLFGGGHPLRIGRYRIERRLGAGGMGEVYLAHDDDLGRKVAVKRVRATSTSALDQERLRREARALARVSHTNVVQVYEVGEHEGRTFLAMEFVDGQTLGDWLDEAPRAQPWPWRAVLGKFQAAGRGLAVAHEAGLVHRDFKPDNVLLSTDGRVLTADFGLALAGETHRPDDDAARDEPLSLELRMSVTGAILGTIRYMPLEQIRGAEVDARSDQFSFCVALYEALWGTPPFSLANATARLRDLQAGDPPTPKPVGASHPPAQLWRVIRRGLSKDPAARWPDMNALLAALDGVTRRRRRLAWLGSAAAAITLASGVAVYTHDATPDPCAAIERELEGTWDDARRAALAASPSAHEAGHAAHSLELVVAGLDRWSAGWVEQRSQVCRASVERRIEPELGRLQSTCLTRQRQRVEVLVELLSRQGISGDALAGAVEAVADLPPASACEDELALLGVEPPAQAITEQVEALRSDVARAHELRLLGSVDEGLSLAEQTERAARELGYGPLHAEALAELGKAEFAAGSLERAAERMLEAIDAAELNHHDYLAADLWTVLSMLTIVELDDPENGAWQLRRAEAATGRATTQRPRALARLAFARGQLAERHGDAVGAELGYRAALSEAQKDEAAGPDLSSYLSNLARLVGARDPSGGEALKLHQAALDKANIHYGPEHPQTARRLYLLGIALLEHDPSRVEVLLRRAAQIWTTSHARPHYEAAQAHLLLAKLALQNGEIEGAEAHAHEVAAIQAQILPSEHADHGEVANLLATIYAVQGDQEAAIEQARVALAHWEPIDGLESPSVQRLHSDIASQLLALGRIDAAAAELEALLPHVQDTPEQVSVQLRLCEVALRRGQLEAADAQLQVIAAFDQARLGHHAFSYALLRALVEIRRGELQPTALVRLRAARGDTIFTAGQISTWLAQLDVSAAERATLQLD